MMRVEISAWWQMVRLLSGLMNRSWTNTRLMQAEKRAPATVPINLIFSLLVISSTYEPAVLPVPQSSLVDSFRVNSKFNNELYNVGGSLVLSGSRLCAVCSL